MAQERDEDEVQGKNNEERTKPTALGDMVEIFRANVGDTIAYGVMALGLILCFFEPFLGGLPVGFIMGLYFSRKVFQLAGEFKEFLVSEGIFRGFIIIASLMALAISAPGLSLGVGIGALARPLFGNSITSPGDDQTQTKLPPEE